VRERRGGRYSIGWSNHELRVRWAREEGRWSIDRSKLDKKERLWRHGGR